MSSSGETSPPNRRSTLSTPMGAADNGDGYADVGNGFPVNTPGPGTIQEQRFLGHVGDDQGPARLKDASRNALVRSIHAAKALPIAQSVRRPNT